MILDQFGKPVNGGLAMIAPRWLMDETAEHFRQWDALRRVSELRASLGGDLFGVGKTVKVRLPARFTVKSEAGA